MESVSTAERQIYRNGTLPSRRTDSRKCSPRLPTPETSRSSKASLDEQVPRVYARQGPQILELLSHDPSDHRNISTERPDDRSMRRNSRHHYIPQSPPYQPADVQRLSLPPLKTILGDAISSPPDTPRTQDAPFQPSPREPLFTASTFKPPSLYPNKKPRTERTLDPSPTFHSKSNLSSPGIPSAPFDPVYARATRRPSNPYTHQAAYSGREDVRRMSTQHDYPYHSDQISPGTIPYRYERSGREVPSAQVHPSARHEYRSNEYAASGTLPGAPVPHALPHQARPPFHDHSAPHDHYPWSSERASSRRSSIVAHNDYASTRYEAQQIPRQEPYHRTSHYAIAMRDDRSPPKAPLYESRGRDNVDAAAGFNRGSMQDAQAAFFMPSHYDYQQGKTRKRSNLPKQSTEIMKTWFDQNISNPYPSEEQKAIFSNATGISMTQVSNWFINHRRRCPELRDKRDKIRTGSDN